MNTLDPEIDASPVSAPRPKLLLADDSVTIRRVVELTFADEGIDVTTAGDAASAMEKFVEIQPDIVLVDVGLEGTSGYKICEMIKQDEATRHIPVLLLVGSFEPFDQDLAERAGADGFLTKPFQSIRVLVTRVSELLSPAVQPEAEASLAENSAIPSAEREFSDGNEEIALSGPAGEPPPPEVADIENLYQRSFVDTAEIEEFDTVEDLLGDPGLDDELIEASYQTADAAQPPVDAVETKGFSWTQSKVSGESPEKPAESDPALQEAETAARTTSDNDPADETGSVEPADTAKMVDPIDPSPEFIALVAQRVVERLSDQAVRDIAREAVPRIAEKLIREALAEEKKA